MAIEATYKTDNGMEVILTGNTVPQIILALEDSFGTDVGTIAHLHYRFEHRSDLDRVKMMRVKRTKECWVELPRWTNCW